MRELVWLGVLLLSLMGALCGPVNAQPMVQDWCARAVSSDDGEPFAQTIRAQVTLNAPGLAPDLQVLLTRQLLWARVWPDRAVQVHLSPYDPEVCAAAQERQVQLEATLSAQEVANFQADANRGPLMLTLAQAVIQRAWVRIQQGETAAVPQREWLHLFFATNRQATGLPKVGEAFGAERSEVLTRGSVEVSVLRQAKFQQLDNPAVLKLEKTTAPSEVAVAQAWRELSPAQWADEIRARAMRFEKPGILVFIHGYNVSFVEAAQRAGQLAYDLAFPGPTVFVAWPSDARVIRYLQDGRDAENSWAATQQVLDELTTISPNGPVYIVAHSMGNRVMLGGLAQLLREQPQRRHAIEKVVMAAPDVDQETFRLNWAKQVLNLGIHFTLYASDRDLTMSFSETLQGGFRMGQGGKNLLKMRGLDVVDASAVTRDFFGLNHSYFGDQASVLADLFYLLRQKKTPEKRPNLLRLDPPYFSVWAMRREGEQK